jgi:hypothetical protein
MVVTRCCSISKDLQDGLSPPRSTLPSQNQNLSQKSASDSEVYQGDLIGVNRNGNHEIPKSEFDRISDPNPIPSRSSLKCGKLIWKSKIVNSSTKIKSNNRTQSSPLCPILHLLLDWLSLANLEHQQFTGWHYRLWQIGVLSIWQPRSIWGVRPSNSALTDAAGEVREDRAGLGHVREVHWQCPRSVLLVEYAVHRILASSKENV